MSTILNLEDFKVWQKARLLNKEIVQLTNTSIFNSAFDLKKQMRSAALSVVANLAEGYGRQGNKEFLHFLSIARASVVELKSHIYTCLDLALIKLTDAEVSFELIKEIQKMSLKLMEHIRESSYKGAKFKR